ncbi:MAG: alpha/beta hydrolase fold protein [Devosia sp.]|nr:alpha/beta hydrolase [Devosia sp.]MDB5529496.1 alpha/beta hydrolase fold protein [Devosia sp.]
MRKLFAPLVVASMLAVTAAHAETVPVNGMNIYYEISGEGDPLVVLPGAYMTIPDMGAIIPMLAKTHKVIAMEFQGHGRTEDIDRPITYENLADDVAGLMDALDIPKADIFGYSMGAGAAIQLTIRHPEKVDQLVSASAGYDISGMQPAYTAFIPQMKPEMFIGTPMEDAWKKLAVNPDGFPAFVDKMIALEHEPLAWEAGVKTIKSPVLVIAGDSDVITLEHEVAFFKLLGGGVMGDMGAPLAASRLAILPATAHTAVINQPELLHAFIEPFLQGETPKSFMGM